MKSWRTKALAGLLGTSSVLGGLAILPAAVNAEVAANIESPRFPTSELEMLDTPAYPSMLMLEESGNTTVRREFMYETQVGAMHDEFGPFAKKSAVAFEDPLDPNASVNPTAALARQALDDAAIEVPDDDLIAVGDLDPEPQGDPDDDPDPLRSPDVAWIKDGTLSISEDFDEGLGLRESSVGTPLRIDLTSVDASDGAKVAGAGVRIVGVGFFDGYRKIPVGLHATPTNQNKVWVITYDSAAADSKRIQIHLFALTGEGAPFLDQRALLYQTTRDLTGPDSAFSVPLDAVSWSVLDQDVRASEVVRSGYVGLLAAYPFTVNGSTGMSARIIEYRILDEDTQTGGVSVRANPGIDLIASKNVGTSASQTSLPDRGELKVDVADTNHDPNDTPAERTDVRVTYAGLVSGHNGEHRENILVADAERDLGSGGQSTGGPFCATHNLVGAPVNGKASQEPHLDLDLSPEGRIITCATDGGVRAGLGDDGDADTVRDDVVLQRYIITQQLWSTPTLTGWVDHENDPVGQAVAGSTHQSHAMVVEDIKLDRPCEWLLKSVRSLEGDGYDARACSTGSIPSFPNGNGPPTYEFPGRISTIVQLRSTEDGAHSLHVLSRHPQEAPIPRVLAGAPVPYLDNGWNYSIPLSHGRWQMVSLPAMTNRVLVQLDQNPIDPMDPDDPNDPDDTVNLAKKAVVTNLDPNPVAVLQSPPYVRGAGQVPLAGPTYNTRETSGDGEGETSSMSMGGSFGVDIGDASGMFGFSMSVGLERQVSTETSTEIEVTQNEQFVGSPEEDTIVYQVPSVYRFEGTIVASTIGVGLGERTRIDIPRGVTVSSSTLSALQRQFPHRFGNGSNPSDKGILTHILPHTAGNPGSYLEWDGVAGQAATSTTVQTYCDNQTFHEPSATDQSEVDRIRNAYPNGTAPNPFLADRDLDNGLGDLSGPGILASTHHDIQVNTPTSEGAGVSITESTEFSRLSETTVSAEVVAKAFYGTLGAEHSSSWGRSWSASFGNGIDFLGYVGHLPTELPDETYAWHLFLCKKRTTEGLPVWVQGFTVDGYDGSGGLEDLGEVQLTKPINSAFATLSNGVHHLQPEFKLHQESGTISEYRVEIEAIGAPGAGQHFTVPRLEYIDPTNSVAAKARSKDVTISWGDLVQANTAERAAALAAGEPVPPVIPTQLLPNQLYRWRATATDLFGNESTSEYEFFRSTGPPNNLVLELSDPTPDAGQAVTATISHDATAAPVSYVIDWGDGTSAPSSTSKVHTKTYGTAGVYSAKVTATMGFYISDTTTVVSVGASAADESYPSTTPVRPRPKEDTVFTVPASQGVKTNDTGAQLVTLSGNPQHGSVDLSPDGAFTYTPAPHYCGTDRFSYAVLGGPATKVATATLDIECVDDAPTLPATIEYTIDEDTPLNPGAAGGVLAGVQDGDVPSPVRGTTHKAELVGANPANATSFSLAANGSFSFVPKANHCTTNPGGSPITFKVKAVDEDGLASSPDSTVRINVTCLNDKPTAAPVSYGPAAPRPVEDSTFTLSDPTKGLRAKGASDVESSKNNLSISLGTAPTKGSVAVNADGTFTYTPNANACGVDTFGYVVTDPFEGESDPEGIVTLDIECINDAPTAVARTYGATEDQTLTTTTPDGVLQGAEDVDADELTVTLDTPPTKAAPNGFLLRPDGSFTYKPRANFCGTDAFSYTVSDGKGGTVTPPAAIVNVACVNDVPVPVADTFPAIDGQTLTVAAPGVLGNDTDVEDGRPTVVAGTFTSASGGPVTIKADGSFTYTAPAGIYGQDSVSYTVRDSDGATATAQLTFDVKARTKLVAVKGTKAGKTVTLKATLTLVANGHPVPERTLFFVRPTGAALCSGVTDTAGTATCSVTGGGLLGGAITGQYQAVFDGDGLFLPAVSNKVSVGGLL